MRRIIRCSLFTAMLITSISCDELTDCGTESVELELSGKWIVWQLQLFQDSSGRVSSVGTEDLTLVFLADTVVGQAFPKEGPRVSGNRYGDNYSITSTGGMTMAHVWETLAGIPPGSRIKEFVNALRTTRRYRASPMIALNSNTNLAF